MSRVKDVGLNDLRIRALGFYGSGYRASAMHRLLDLPGRGPKP